MNKKHILIDECGYEIERSDDLKRIKKAKANNLWSRIKTRKRKEEEQCIKK